MPNMATISPHHSIASTPISDAYHALVAACRPVFQAANTSRRHLAHAYYDTLGRHACCCVLLATARRHHGASQYLLFEYLTTHGVAGRRRPHVWQGTGITQTLRCSPHRATAARSTAVARPRTPPTRAHAAADMAVLATGSAGSATAMSSSIQSRGHECWMHGVGRLPHSRAQVFQLPRLQPGQTAGPRQHACWHSNFAEAHDTTAAHCSTTAVHCTKHSCTTAAPHHELT